MKWIVLSFTILLSFRANARVDGHSVWRMSKDRYKVRSYKVVLVTKGCKVQTWGSYQYARLNKRTVNPKTTTSIDFGEGRICKVIRTTGV